MHFHRGGCRFLGYGTDADTLSPDLTDDQWAFVAPYVTLMWEDALRSPRPAGVDPAGPEQGGRVVVGYDWRPDDAQHPGIWPPCRLRRVQVDEGLKGSSHCGYAGIFAGRAGDAGQRAGVQTGRRTGRGGTGRDGRIGRSRLRRSGLHWRAAETRRSRAVAKLPVAKKGFVLLPKL